MIRSATALTMLVIQLPAQTAPQAAAAPPKPPTPTAAHHQFDFWLGEWEVRDPGGRVVGHNTIMSIANGFGLLENWTDLRGGSGKSLNAYDAAAGGWHQTWVGGGGGVIKFDGGLKDGKMWLEGSRKTGAGPVRDRMTYEPRPDGTVRQLWETSVDGGSTWQVAFDGIYVKKAAVSHP